LFVLTAAGILPLALMAGIGLYVLARQQEHQTEQVGLELARSVANAIDSELRSSTSVLEALATSPRLDGENLSGFVERARRVIQPRPHWVAIQLADPDGTPLVDTRAAGAGGLTPVQERESFDRVVRMRTPAVGNLTRHPREDWAFAVRAPVLRGDEVKYVLTALVKPAAIRDVLTRQQVPGDWVISIVDARGQRVARSRAHEENLGGRLSETVQRVVDAGGAEGFGLAYTLEGEHIFTPYSRLPSSGWVAVLGIPTALVDAAAHRSLAVYGGGVLLSILLGTIAALRVARSITRPIAGLRAAAEALGRREVPAPPATSILEIREMGAALRSAAEELTASDAERETLLRKERQAREAAESADRAKEEFMAVLSHELRTPLNAVYGWARMLHAGQIRDEALAARAREAIVRNADAQIQLIDDLLDLSRITSGKMRLEVRPVELPGVLRAALDAVRPAADAKNIRLQTMLELDAGPVAGDPARLQQVVWNLLMNAVKFTPAGGEVQLRLQRASGHAEIVVSDTGQGISPEMLPHVFERFRQADSSSTRSHGGLGLGLALVKHLVELHGGTVVAQSDGVGRGATFVVALPIPVADVLTPSPSRAQARGLAADALHGIVSLEGLQVLVVDDDADAIALIEAILTGAGAAVRACTSASAALNLLREWRPDVLVSDIEMAGEDGYALIRTVRGLAAEEGGETPAIAVSAYGRPQDRLRSLAEGFTMHVPKPVDPGELTAIVAGIAGQPERPQPS
jgi:signal transduction histidine kinase/ActR/RegA family two-component response regulator